MYAWLIGIEHLSSPGSVLMGHDPKSNIKHEIHVNVSNSDGNDYISYNTTQHAYQQSARQQ